VSNAQIPEARPTTAGMYDYYLGGTSHTSIDAAAAAQMLELMPELADGAIANRGFLQRAVKWISGECGVRQFIDIGSGLPTERNTHDALGEVIADGRVVYVDVDPLVVARATEVLAPLNHTTAIQADVQDVDAILDHPETKRLIDFQRPVGILLVAVLHFVPDDADPWDLVRRYLDAVPSGSYLGLSHGSVYHQVTARVAQGAAKLYGSTPTPPTDRSKTEIERFFHGLEIVPPYPGADAELVHLGMWGAEDPSAADSDGSRMGYAAVARKP
jgi:hypothetical protein